MTDPLREAAKRLRELRVDVERLKSGGRAGGVLRILRSTTDPTDADDATATGSTATMTDTETAADDTATGPAADVDAETAADDPTHVTERSVSGATWGGTGWEEDTWK